MTLRLALTTLAALILAGCSGWAAETRLIPAAERDVVRLSGIYQSSEEQARFMPTSQRMVLVSDPQGEERGSKLAFDLLREKQADPESTPDRTYLVEVPWAKDDGSLVFFYSLVRVVDGAHSSGAGAFDTYTLKCSDVAATLSQQRDGELCIFDDYARLRRAALDALNWYDEARMEVKTTRFERQADAP
ncbi:MAG: hypothetical protein AAF559_06095 [Pseudomonadota bacterium]